MRLIYDEPAAGLVNDGGGASCAERIAQNPSEIGLKLWRRGERRRGLRWPPEFA